jgi:hypothetical protein
VIGLWLDTMGGEPPMWIVSRDAMNASGEAVSTDTLDTFAEDEYESARARALLLGGRHGVPVVQTALGGTQEDIWTPPACGPDAPEEEAA